ncbi:unnamed protein product [Phytophthora fragariaefolia]|uniref:Unnamed protein product n=1 Tax=Phytophthora fragariaefolia TaxID=1490495 RepID=A0A9W6X473_9STRA|nr:unnamed protein product [Phytophthora fragariaefolia]
MQTSATVAFKLSLFQTSQELSKSLDTIGKMSSKIAASGGTDVDALPLSKSNRQHPLRVFLNKAKRVWDSLQISHCGGRYSIERLLALEEYARSTSLARVMMVCLGTPLPTVVVVALQECVPLQDPSAGWGANYGFWIRAGVLAGVVAVGIAAFALYMVPGVALSNLQLVLLCIGQGVATQMNFPEAVIFTVDFFNSMYLATCMQNASSISTALMMMTLDITQSILELRRLHYRTDTIVSRLYQASGSIAGNGSILQAVESLCRDISKFEQQNRQGVIIESCLPHKVSAEVQTLLEMLKYVPGNGDRNVPRFCMVDLRNSFRSKIERARAHTSPQSILKFTRSMRKIEPSDAISVKPTRRATNDDTKRLTATTTPHKNILSETLEVLFTTECVVLTEYLESIIPVLYGNFILLVVHLPSARYHKDLVGITPESVGGTISNIFIYATLEFASFIFLIYMMMRNCRLRALYHLAFVLETQMLLVQELQSVGVGIALGLVLVSCLTLFPGEPFEYTTDNAEACTRPDKSQAFAAANDELREPNASSNPTDSTTEPRKQDQIAEIEKAAQRVKVQKLQELLGLEREKAQQLVQRAKQEALDAVETSGQLRCNYTGSNKSAWLDRAFFAIMFGLLVWVLWQDYSINLFSVAAHMFPREAEVVRQVFTAAWALLARVSALME